MSIQQVGLRLKLLCLQLYTLHGLKSKSGEAENSFRPLNAATLWIGVLENSDKDKRLLRKQSEAYNLFKWLQM